MAKVINLKKSESLEELKAKLIGAQKNTRCIQTKNYSGIITLTESPVQYQKRIRDEWN